MNEVNLYNAIIELEKLTEQAMEDKTIKKPMAWALHNAWKWADQNEEPREERWIPVSERLPKAGEYIGDVDKYYLVQNEYGDMLVARYTHSEYWEQIYQLKPIADEIVAWRELPQPYKAESEDKK